MIKLTITLILSIIWFLFSGIFIAQKVDVESWGYSFLLYIAGLYWVIPYILSKNMSAPYIDHNLTPKDKNKWQRRLLFSIGLIISLAAST
tara:strand:- start:1782 stop:2051 length:270 start_codon:yes stop_codon:yes gene_type:complete